MSANRSMVLCLVFTGEGVRIDSIGRRGQGPGEFRSVQRLTLVGDSITVVDAALNRTQLFDPAGGLIGTWHAVPASYPPPYAANRPRAVLADGSVLVEPRVLASSSPETVPLFRQRGRSVVQIGEVEWEAPMMRVQFPPIAHANLRNPLRSPSLWEVAHDGREIVILGRSTTRGEPRSRFHELRYQATRCYAEITVSLRDDSRRR
jgi:hypothetical protein